MFALLGRVFIAILTVFSMVVVLMLVGLGLVLCFRLVALLGWLGLSGMLCDLVYIIIAGMFGMVGDCSVVVCYCFGVH